MAVQVADDLSGREDSADVRGRAAGRSQPGRRRSSNQDALLINPELGVYAVCDGIGGCAAGEVAASLAVSIIESSIAAWRAGWPARPPQLDAGLDLVAAASDAVQAASEVVFDAASKLEEQAGMGTTATVALQDGRRLAMAHVGDSRLYLVRGGRTTQLSTDHTVTSELVRSGHLAPDLAATHPYRNSLTRFVGADPSPEVDLLLLDVEAGDRLILTSDGANPAIGPTPCLGERLLGMDGSALAGALIQQAVRAGSKDDVTVVVVDLECGTGGGWPVSVRHRRGARSWLSSRHERRSAR